MSFAQDIEGARGRSARPEPATAVDQPELESPAVGRGEAGAAEWRGAVHAQLGTTAFHGDFYALAGHMVDTLRALEAMARLLIKQAQGYGAGRGLYDDEAANPAHRLRSAVLALAEVRAGLVVAERAANRYWSAIGHLGTASGEGDR